MNKILLLILVFFLVSNSYAEGLKLHYAGFAFMGNSADVEKNYPVSYKLSQEMDQKGLYKLQDELLKKILAIKSEKYTITTDLGDLNSGSAVSLAFALDWENVSIEQISDIRKIVIDLHGQLLAFDFKEKKIIAAFPVAVQLIHSEQCTDNSKVKWSYEPLIRKMFYDSDYVNIFDEVVKKLSQIEIKEKYGHRIKVIDVVFEEEALKTINEQNINSSTTKVFIAGNFAKYLSTNQGISVLPYTVGQAIGGKMAARFANGEVYNLEVPVPDYNVIITLRKFQKAEFDRTSAEIGFVFGSYFNIKVVQPELNKVYMDAKLRGTLTKTVPISQTSFDDWTIYQESVFRFFDDFTSQITNPTNNWLKDASSMDSSVIKKQFNELAIIVKKCK